MCRRAVVPVLVFKDQCREEQVQSQRSIASRRQFEDRFQALARRTFDAAFECRIREGSTEEIGQALAEALQPLLGYVPHNSQPPEGWASCIHPDDQAIVALHLKRVRYGHRDLCVFRAVTPAGLVRWFGVLTRPAWDAASRCTRHVYGLVQDHSAHTDASPAGPEAGTAQPALPHLVAPSAL